MTQERNNEIKNSRKEEPMKAVAFRVPSRVWFDFKRMAFEKEMTVSQLAAETIIAAITTAQPKRSR